MQPAVSVERTALADFVTVDCPVVSCSTTAVAVELSYSEGPAVAESIPVFVAVERSRVEPRAVEKVIFAPATVDCTEVAVECTLVEVDEPVQVVFVVVAVVESVVDVILDFVLIDFVAVDFVVVALVVTEFVAVDFVDLAYIFVVLEVVD